jgi:hypothetical protein
MTTEETNQNIEAVSDSARDIGKTCSDPDTNRDVRISFVWHTANALLGTLIVFIFMLAGGLALLRLLGPSEGHPVANGSIAFPSIILGTLWVANRVVKHHKRIAGDEGFIKLKLTFSFINVLLVISLMVVTTITTTIGFEYFFEVSYLGLAIIGFVSVFFGLLAGSIHVARFVTVHGVFFLTDLSAACRTA